MERTTKPITDPFSHAVGADDENCLTGTKKVLEAYGVDLPDWDESVSDTISVASLPNVWYISLEGNTYYPDFMGDDPVVPTSYGKSQGTSQSEESNKGSRLKWDYNGHYYEVVKKTLSWDDAKAYAENQQFSDSSTGVIYRGYLATITTPDENSWIAQNMISPLNVQNCVWLGGYREEGYDDRPSEGWHWVTGEPWSWTNWDIGEPNNWNNVDERYLDMWISDFDGRNKGMWNDLPITGLDFGHTDYSLIEYEPITQNP